MIKKKKKKKKETLSRSSYRILPASGFICIPFVPCVGLNLLSPSETHVRRFSHTLNANRTLSNFFVSPIEVLAFLPDIFACRRRVAMQVIRGRETVIATKRFSLVLSATYART